MSLVGHFLLASAVSEIFEQVISSFELFMSTLEDQNATSPEPEAVGSPVPEEDPHNGPDVPLQADEMCIRQPRTHTSPGVVQAFKSLTLKFKLKMCKDIEQQNDERNMRTLLNASNPQSHPEPGSETASMFTIDDDDLNRLKRPSFAALFKEVMPTFLANFLADHDFSDAAEHKRETEPISDQRVAKRRCMDGAILKPRVVDAPLDIQFTQLLYETEDCGMVPLPLFLNASLLYLTVNGANVPTFKANPKPGEKKGFTIIDCQKLLARLGTAELEMSHAQWMEAAFNCFRFQCSRDIVESGGAFSSWWEKHFDFFNLQKDKVHYYDAWKSMELEIRQEFYAQPTIYDAYFYARRYDIVKNTFDLKSQMHSMISGSSKGTRVMPSASSTSFPSSSGKSSPLACCILCGERGHTLVSHAGDTSPAKSFHGKPAFAKYVSKVLRSPDGREICIRWNIRNSTCDHGTDRAHICSFCGGSHYAFSWTCRPKPTDV